MESRRNNVLLRWLLAAAVLATGAGSAWAQQCVPSCFEKTWRLARDLQFNGRPDPGDIIEYQITLCNSAPGAVCAIQDAIDALNRNPGDLTLVNNPQVPAGSNIECLPNDAGTTTCVAAPQGVSVSTCSVDQISDSASAVARMPAGGCLTVMLWAEIAALMVPPFPTLCNQAVAGSAVSNDPSTPAPADPTCFDLGVNQGAIASSRINTSFTDACPANPSFPRAGDGRIAPGEELTLTLGIINIGGLNIPATPPPFLGEVEARSTYSILAGTSDYSTTVQPNILLANSANYGTNDTPFRIRIDPMLPCPQLINLSLKLTRAWGEPFAADFRFLVDDCAEACVTPPADIATTKVLSPAGQTGTVGQPVRFRITVTNNGPGTLQNGTLSDTLDASGCLSLLNCSKVTCNPGTSGATCGTCTAFPAGFIYDFANLPQGRSITFDVETTAAVNTPSCLNSATVPDGVVGDTNDVGEAIVCIGPACVPAPDYTVSKTASPPSVSKGGTAQYTITVDNIGTVNLTGCTFTDNVNAPSCASLATCDGSSPSIPINCNIGTGTISSAAPFGVPVGQKQTVTFTVTAGNTPGPCPNTVNVSCQTGGDRVGQGSIEITGATYNVTKTASPGSASPGTPAQFTITIDNPGSAPITGCTFTDNVNATGCMTLTSCDGSNPTIPITCNTGAGIISSASPFSVGGGSRQTVAFTVTAGTIPGPCNNTVSVSCQTGGDAMAHGAVNITGSPCALMTNDPPITFPPVNPAKLGQWVYTSSCQGLTQSILASPANGLNVEPVGNTAGNLDLYTLDCPCAQNDICFVKDSTTRTSVVFYYCQ